MKMYRGNKIIAPLILNLSTSLGEWSASRFGRFTPGQGPHYLLNTKLCGPHGRPGRFERRGKSAAPVGNRIPDRPYRSPVTITYWILTYICDVPCSKLGTDTDCPGRSFVHAALRTDVCRNCYRCVPKLLLMCAETATDVCRNCYRELVGDRFLPHHFNNNNNNNNNIDCVNTSSSSLAIFGLTLWRRNFTFKF